jgi:hypothetical protein
MPALRPVQAIYYPHIQFRSIDWVKSVLFYWEGVFRLVYEEVEPDDDAATRELVEAGLVKDLAVRPYRGPALEILGRRLEELASKGDGALPKCVPGLAHIDGLTPELVSRLLERLVHDLERLGCSGAARIVAEQGPQALTLYVTVLASLIAREQNLSPVTDDPLFDAVCTYLDADDVDDHAHEDARAAELVAAELSVPTPSVESVAGLSVKQVVEIRKSLATARRTFRQHVQSRLGDIATLPSVQAVHDHLAQLAGELQNELEEAREALKRTNVQTGWSFLGASAPASLSVGTALAGQSIAVAGPLGGVASAVLGVTGWYIQQKKPAHGPIDHYLLTVERAVATENGNAVSRAMKRLLSRG